MPKRKGVLLGPETAKRVLKWTSQKSPWRSPVGVNRRGGSGGGASIYQYVLTSNWSSGSATADIYESSGIGPGDLIEEDASLFDPTRQSLMTDQEVGDVGWCHLQDDDRYYAWQGPCTGSSTPSTPGGGGGDGGPEITDDTFSFSTL